MGDQYDVGNIAGSDSMNSKEREFFARYGNALEQQADLIAQQHGLEGEEQEKTLDVLLRDLEGKKNEYVVQGALLQCSKGTCNRQTLMHRGKELESLPVQKEAYTRIQVPEDREAGINELIPACVEDYRGGLRDNRDGEVNIHGFGNCGDITRKVALEDLLARAGLTDREAEVREAIEAGKGTCHCLMKLNESWENLPLAGEYLTGYFDIPPDLVEYERDRCSSSYLRFNGKEGINMMSMLFCSFGGGIITARESGQRINIVGVSALACTAGGEHKGSLEWEQMKSNAIYIYNYLTERGWSMEATCGLMGNIFMECKMNPGAWQYWNQMGKGQGYGLVQWSPSREFMIVAGFRENVEEIYADDKEMTEEADANAADCVNEWATEYPQALMDMELEYLLDSLYGENGTTLRWYDRDMAQPYYKKLMPSCGAPSSMSVDTYVTSDWNAGDLALVFHASYERSGGETENLQDRVDAANKWYEYFSGANPNVELDDFPQ